MDENGDIVLCLPGQKGFCGKGYACFFSGYNYHCCPSDEDDRDAALECPSPALTVLNDKGIPMKCDLEAKRCPQKSMFCAKIGSERICCERIVPVDNDYFKSMKAVEGDLSNLECPPPAFTILDGTGQPLKCIKENCSTFGRYCYKGHGIPICCEGREEASDEEELIHRVLNVTKSLNEKERSVNQNRLKNYLSSSNEHSHEQPESTLAIRPAPENKISKPDFKDGSLQVTDFKKSEEARAEHKAKTETAERSSEAVKELHYSTTKPSVVPKRNVSSVSTPQQIKTSQALTTPFTIPPSLQKANHEKVNGVVQYQSNGGSQEQAHSRISETVEYTPHSAGGYAVSRTSSVRSKMDQDDTKEYARSYLLNQIRHGWPYNERFYRPQESFDSRLSSVSGAQVIFHGEQQ